jgi:hypothetical protein
MENNKPKSYITMPQGVNSQAFRFNEKTRTFQFNLQAERGAKVQYFSKWTSHDGTTETRNSIPITISEN